MNTGNKKAGRDILSLNSKDTKSKGKETGDLKEKECVNCFHRICTKVSTALDIIVSPHITVLILYAKYFRSCIQGSLDVRCL